MAHEKQFTAKQVARNVLQKVGEMLKKSDVLEKKYEGFKAVEESAKESGASNPAAVAASIGRKKYGKEAFQEAAAKGHKMNKAEKDEEIRRLQKKGLSPEQIKNHLDKAENPDEKEDAKLGEKVEKEVEDHMSANKEAEKKEERYKVEKSELITEFENLESLLKGETKHDRCVEHVKENSPDVKNPHAVCVAEGVKPEKWSKAETENSKKLGYKLSEEGKKEVQPEKSDNAFKVESGKAKSSNDPRLGSTPSPESNGKEQAEGNNELAGTTPTQVGQDGKNKPGGDEIKGHLKLAKFVGRMDYKRQNKQNQQKVASQEHIGNTQAESSTQHKESVEKSEIGVHPKSSVSHQAEAFGEKRMGGQSVAGTGTRGHKMSGSTHALNEAVGQHKKVLGELKGMSKPKLPG